MIWLEFDLGFCDLEYCVLDIFEESKEKLIFDRSKFLFECKGGEYNL